MSDNRTTELQSLSKLKVAGKLRYWRGTIEIPESELHAICDEIQAEHDQAIAATLGNSRAERTCKFVSSKGSDYPPVCSACGYELGIYDCEWFEDGTYGYDGNYCPNCGARVVE